MAVAGTLVVAQRFIVLENFDIIILISEGVKLVVFLIDETCMQVEIDVEQDILHVETKKVVLILVEGEIRKNVFVNELIYFFI